MSEENGLSNGDNTKLKSRMTANLEDLYLFCFLLFFFFVSKTSFDFFNPAICGNLADTAVI